MGKTEINKEYIKKLSKVVENKQEKEAKAMLDELHAADIAEIYNHLNTEEIKYLYLLLDGEKAADVLAELEDDDRDSFLEIIPSEIIAEQFINYMESDDAADAIGHLPEKKKREIISHIADLEQADDIVDLLHYDEDTAGGLMAKEIISIEESHTVKSCLKEIARQAEDVDEIYYLYVVDSENKLIGNITLKKLLLANTSSKITNLYNKNIIYVTPNTTSEEVANIMDKYDLVALPVVDNNKQLIGRITIDDVVDVIREEADKDYQMLSGISEDVEPSDGTWTLTRARLPWLMVGLTGGIIGAQVISGYETQLEEHASMAFFIPLIAAMGGNVGVQSSAIVVQGLANKSIDLDSTFHKILKELSVASINAVSCSFIIFVYNYFFIDDFTLTLTVSIALFIVIIFASIFGTFVPLALNRFKIDPALATGPFITTVNDILGLLIYLAIGSFIYGFTSL